MPRGKTLTNGTVKISFAESANEISIRACKSLLILSNSQIFQNCSHSVFSDCFDSLRKLSIKKSEFLSHDEVLRKITFIYLLGRDRLVQKDPKEISGDHTDALGNCNVNGSCTTKLCSLRSKRETLIAADHS